MNIFSNSRQRKVERASLLHIITRQFSLIPRFLNSAWNTVTTRGGITGAVTGLVNGAGRGLWEVAMLCGKAPGLAFILAPVVVVGGVAALVVGSAAGLIAGGVRGAFEGAKKASTVFETSGDQSFFSNVKEIVGYAGQFALERGRQNLPGQFPDTDEYSDFLEDCSLLADLDNDHKVSPPSHAATAAPVAKASRNSSVIAPGQELRTSVANTSKDDRAATAGQQDRTSKKVPVRINEGLDPKETQAQFMKFVVDPDRNQSNTPSREGATQTPAADATKTHGAAPH